MTKVGKSSQNLIRLMMVMLLIKASFQKSPKGISKPVKNPLVHNKPQLHFKGKDSTERKLCESSEVEVVKEAKFEIPERKMQAQLDDLKEMIRGLKDDLKPERETRSEEVRTVRVLDGNVAVIRPNNRLAKEKIKNLIKGFVADPKIDKNPILAELRKFLELNLNYMPGLADPKNDNKKTAIDSRVKRMSEFLSHVILFC